jgi:hypothetical protein
MERTFRRRMFTLEFIISMHDKYAWSDGGKQLE